MFAGSAGRIVAQLVIQVALARLLGPQAFGQYAVVLLFVGIGWLLADSGFGAALIQKQDLHERDIAQALGWVLLVGTLVAALLFASAPLIADLMADPALVPMLRASSVLVFLLSLSNIPTSLLRRRLDERRLQIIQFAAYVGASGAVSITLALAGAGAWSLVGGFAAQTVVTMLFAYASVRHTLRPRLGGDAGFRGFGLKVLANNIVNWAIESLDRGLVGKLWGIHALGLYSVAANLSRAPLGLMVNSFQAIAFSSASRLQDDDIRTRRAYLAVLGAVSLFMFPGFAVAALEAEPVLRLVYGEQWLGAAPVFAAFAVAMPLYALGAVTGPFLQARDLVERELLVQLVVVVLLFGGFLLCREVAFEQAVWVVPGVYLARYALLLAALMRALPLQAADLVRALAGGLALAALGLAIARVISHWLAPAEMPALLAPLAGGVVATALALRLCANRLMGRELRQILLGRAGDSLLARTVCRAMGLRSDHAGIA